MSEHRSVDQFNNLVVELADAKTVESFGHWLQALIREATADKRNSILVRLRGSANGLVELFQTTTLFVVRGWIVDSESGYLELHMPIAADCNIPPYKTSRIGVLVVLHNGQSIYVVKEKYGPSLFKFVSGAVEAGESAIDAAVREVREELSIAVDARDMALKAVHQERNARPGVDDYCFVFSCRVPVGTPATIQTSELLACKTVPIAEAESDASLTAYAKTLVGMLFA